MNRPLIKICGITNVRDARVSLKHGADMLGFNFYDKSPRYIEPEKAGIIISEIKKDYEFTSVGVFVNPDKSYVDSVISLTGIDILQFHGDESPSFIENFDKKIIKAFRIKDGSEISKFRKYDSADYFLFDAFSETSFGGTGKMFDWDILANINFRDKLFLSGGINGGNITEAVKKINPYAVDLCSSLEKKPGTKDPDKIREFFLIINKM